MKNSEQFTCKVKKVYADYHGMRYTRDTDGKLGQWKLSGTALMSKAKNRDANWNADLVDENGRHYTSALSYPAVGMQSQNDPDYIEYQILLGKAANIDGFIVEWGFPEHDATVELIKILKIAEKYDFEVGINWCDAWHFYNWIENVHPDIKDREDKVEYFKKSLQYLLDNVYSAKISVKADGHPVIFMFGGGPNAEEFRNIKECHYNLSQGMESPLFLGRAPINGRDLDGKVEYYFDKNQYFEEDKDGKGKLFDGAFGWIPTRVRRGEGTAFENWDRYATKEDSVCYIKTLLDSFKENRFALRVSSVCPEMDNRGCASWGKHDLSHIPRENGDTYRRMWDFNIDNREDIDIIFIVSWNDFTERHQIEPTVEEGDREIRTTEEYASKFKGIASDPSGVSLPLKLFNCRKKAAFLFASDINTLAINKALDNAAMDISRKRYNEAENMLAKAAEDLTELEGRLSKEKIIINVPSTDATAFSNKDKVETEGSELDLSQSIYVRISEGTSKILRQNNYCGWLHFEYLDQGDDNILVQTHTMRKPLRDGDFSVVCDIKKDNTGEWKKARVQVFKENCTMEHGLLHVTDFVFEGTSFVKNIRFEFEIYKKAFNI